MAVSQEELEISIKNYGNRLFKQPTSRIDDLIELLDQLESCLSRVYQKPSGSMQNALAPSMRALVSSELMHHSDEDVKVAVAACISEITRITAPESPYDDDQMKGIFRLIVSSFDKLSDRSSRSYAKRTSILETLSKVRSCIVMLDIECDALIIEMLQIFFREIREYHPEDVCSSIENIMTLVLEESEAISLELLSPILAAVKKENMHSARRMGGKVLQKCAAKIRPYLTQLVKSLEIPLEDYSLVVADICKGMSEVVTEKDRDVSGDNLVNESKLASVASLTEAAQVAEERIAEAVSLQDADCGPETLQKPVMSNGAEQTRDGVKQATNNTEPCIATHENLDDENIIMSDVNVIKVTRISGRQRKPSMKIAHERLDAGNIITSDVKETRLTRVSGRKHNSSMKTTNLPTKTPAETFFDVFVAGPQPFDASPTKGEKELEKLSITEKSQSKEVCSSSQKNPDMTLGSKVHKAMQSDCAIVASLSPGESPQDTSGPEISGRQKKSIFEESAETASKKYCEVPRKPGRPRKNMIKEPTVSADIAAKKFCEVSIDSLKPSESLRDNGFPKKAGRPKKSLLHEPILVDSVSMKISEGLIQLEEKAQVLSGKKVSGTPNDDASAAEAYNLKKNFATASLGMETASLEKGRAKSSVKDVAKETVTLPRTNSNLAKSKDDSKETPKRISKRGRTPAKETVFGEKELGENMIGKRIEVWWPQDQMFYEGVIDSWDPVKKRHKVLYFDGDEESLNLKKQLWKLVEEDSAIGQMKASPKRTGGLSSPKSTVASAKFGSKDVCEEDESEDGNNIKSEDSTPGTSTESADGLHKPVATSKKVGSKTSQIIKELKHTPSTTAEGKGKSVHCSKPSSDGSGEEVVKEKSCNGSKPSWKDTGKVESGLSKVGESEVMNTKSSETPAVNTKRKTPESRESNRVKTEKREQRGDKS